MNVFEHKNDLIDKVTATGRNITSLREKYYHYLSLDKEFIELKKIKEEIHEQQKFYDGLVQELF